MLFEGLIGLPLTGIIELLVEEGDCPLSPGCLVNRNGGGLIGLPILRPLLTSDMVIIRIREMIR